jgi:hypothetical protein
MKRAVDYDDDKIDGQMHPNKGSTKSSRKRAGTQFGKGGDDGGNTNGEAANKKRKLLDSYTFTCPDCDFVSKPYDIDNSMYKCGQRHKTYECKGTAHGDGDIDSKKQKAETNNFFLLFSLFSFLSSLFSLLSSLFSLLLHLTYFTPSLLHSTTPSSCRLILFISSSLHLFVFHFSPLIHFYGRIRKRMGRLKGSKRR